MKATTGIIEAFVFVLIPLTATAADRPSIIVMMVDDMGFAGPSITPYSNPHYKTPGLDHERLTHNINGLDVRLTKPILK